MSTNQHTPYSTGMALTSANLEAPLGQLDAAISSAITSGAGWTTTTDGTASAGQKVIPVASTVGAVVGMPIWIGAVGGTYEVQTIGSISVGVSVTVTFNLTNTYSSGTLVTASPSELVDARDGQATLGTRLDSGLFRKVVDLLYGMTTYSPTAGATQLYVECIGGGGAGGGCGTAVTNAAAAGGGGSGAYSAKWVTEAAVKETFTVAIGAGGTPGAAGANPGGVGGETTFDTGPSICMAKGGLGGLADSVAAGPRIGGAGGAGGPTAGGLGDIVAAGADGDTGIVLAAAQALSGSGGGSEIGGQVAGIKAQGNGTNGHTYGGGGGGGTILSGGAAVAGGQGAPGLIRVWEF